MTEYKLGNATVRIYGTADQSNVKSATERFMRKVIQQKKKKEKEKCT